jgi:predicted amidohydrolase
VSALRAACVQFQARPDKAENLADMAPLVARAAEHGADLVLLPEKWNAWLDGPGLRAQAERLDAGPTVEAMSDWARTHRVNLIGGSIAVLGEGDRVENVSIAYDREGRRIAAYTKIHLFDVDVGGISYRESDGTAPGGEAVVADVDGVRVGMTVCYDLRFPELYRTLTLEGGATVLTVPSNFTLHTGMAHWEVLLRARAIENQAFVLATGQHGYPGGLNKPSYGHSMIIDPWGTVLAQSPEGDGVIVADLDMAALADVRERLPALRHLRPEAYAAPAEPVTVAAAPTDPAARPGG